MLLILKKHLATIFEILNYDSWQNFSWFELLQALLDWIFLMFRWCLMCIRTNTHTSNNSDQNEWMNDFTYACIDIIDVVTVIYV